MVFTPNLQFNMTFSDMHAFYDWEPALTSSFSSPPLTPWNTTFSESPTYVRGMVGVGGSSHTITENRTYGISLTFFGGGVSFEGALDGNWSNDSWLLNTPFSLQVGDRSTDISTPPTSSIIAGMSDLTNARYRARLSTVGLDAMRTMTIKGITLQLALQCPRA
jgi:hypothetical protein